MALIFSNFLWPSEPLLQHPCARAQQRQKKTINIKNFGGTPHGVCPVCPMDMSHLSRGNVPSVPRTFCPLNWNFHMNWPKRPGCPWDVPNVPPGTLPGLSDHRIPFCNLSLLGFSSTSRSEKLSHLQNRLTRPKHSQEPAKEPRFSLP